MATEKQQKTSWYSRSASGKKKMQLGFPENQTQKKNINIHMRVCVCVLDKVKPLIQQSQASSRMASFQLPRRVHKTWCSLSFRFVRRLVLSSRQGIPLITGGEKWRRLDVCLLTSSPQDGRMEPFVCLVSSDGLKKCLQLSDDLCLYL